MHFHWTLSGRRRILIIDCVVITRIINYFRRLAVAMNLIWINLPVHAYIKQDNERQMNAHDENYNCEHICFHHNFFFFFCRSRHNYASYRHRKGKYISILIYYCRTVDFLNLAQNKVYRTTTFLIDIIAESRDT